MSAGNRTGATEFDLGGYIRLDALWASQKASATPFPALSRGITAALPLTRPPDFSFPVPNNTNHGKFLMNANASRFNFTIKGPELWGGKVTGFYRS